MDTMIRFNYDHSHYRANELAAFPSEVAIELCGTAVKGRKAGTLLARLATLAEIKAIKDPPEPAEPPEPMVLVRMMKDGAHLMTGEVGGFPESIARKIILDGAAVEHRGPDETEGPPTRRRRKKGKPFESPETK